MALLLFLGMDSQAEVHPYLMASSSSKHIGGDLLYTKNHMAFADMDGDGNEEFVGIERAAEQSPEMRVVISRWLPETRKKLWQSEKLYSNRSILVGNVDDDPLPELIVFGSRSKNTTQSTLQVIKWKDDAFETTLATHEHSGRLGSLLDIDGDGRNEVLLTTLETPKPQSEIHGIEPVELSVLRLVENRFVQIFGFYLPNGVRAIATGDIESDGEVDVLTYRIGEELNSSRSLGRHQRSHGLVDIYSIDLNEGFRIRDLFRRIAVPSDLSTELPYLNFMGTFKCAEKKYLFIETKTRMWKSYLWLDVDDESEITRRSVDSDAFEIIEMANRSTMAYSADRQAYVHAIDSKSIEFIPKDAIHTPYTARKCGGEVQSD